VAALTLLCIEFLFGCRHYLLFAEKKRNRQETIRGGAGFDMHRLFIWVRHRLLFAEKKRWSQKKRSVVAQALFRFLYKKCFSKLRSIFCKNRFNGTHRKGF
jgi:hypothetical protein